MATCPLWLAFLDRIFDGDAELIAFVQRAVGYSLTGETGEHVFFLLHGTGANGKGTLVETVKKLLGDYARAIRVEALLASNYNTDGGPNEDVANLLGVRFASTAEPGDQFRLNEARVKALTGGDTISARRLHSHLFEFTPTHKIWLAANHKPEIRGLDEGIWRRVLLIPFDVTIPEKERDTKLLDKLAAELPGVLNWAIQGLRTYREVGLNPPERVIAATQDYRAEQNVLADFISELCVTQKQLSLVGKNIGLPSLGKDVYSEYCRWAAENTPQEVMTLKMFSTQMIQSGHPPKRDRWGIVGAKAERRYVGIALRPRAHQEADMSRQNQDTDPENDRYVTQDDFPF
jgi:putative DNA primase/helicase